MWQHVEQYEFIGILEDQSLLAPSSELDLHTPPKSQILITLRTPNLWIP
jgi:hypothetical protein